MKIVYGDEPAWPQPMSYREMMGRAKPGDVWMHESRSESGIVRRMYGIMVLNRHKEVDCIVSSDDKLTALGDVGYNSWSYVLAESIKIVPGRR